MKLTRREREALPYIAVLCLSNKEVAQALGISSRTAEDHRASILRKMDVRNAMELVRKIALEENRGTTNNMQTLR